MTSILTESLGRFERVELLDGVTPIQRLERLERALGLDDAGLYVKRLGGGGNKLRKLGFLLGEARKQGCDTFVTTGGVQSNHARLSAAAAYSGFACGLVLTRLVPRADEDYRRNGNVLPDGLFGATVHEFPAEVTALDAACAAEILAQEAEFGLDFALIAVPDGSSGTHACLAAGLAARIDPRDIRIDGSRRGEGYGIPTEAMVEAVRLPARTEGLLLDPVYSGKAFAGLIAELRAGAFRLGQAVLYVMTGGVPSLFAYRPVFEAAA